MNPRTRNQFGRRRIFLTFFTAFLTLVATFAFFPGVAAQTVCESPYIVQEGDTLSRIATRCDTSVQALLDANPAIVNQRLIYPGQRLAIPVPVNIIPNTGQTTYIVQSGDTLGEIAVRFNTSVQALLNANHGIQDADIIYIGQQLVIPGTAGS